MTMISSSSTLDMSSEGAAGLAANIQKVEAIRTTIVELESRELREGLSVADSSRLGLAYLATGDPRSAANLLKRSAPKKDGDLALVGTIASALLAQDWGAAQSSLASHSWEAAVAEEVGATVECLRIAYFRIVSHAYSTIRLPFLAKMLGLSAEETSQAVAALGWSGGELVLVGPLPPPLSSSPAPDRLSTLTNYTSFLEI